MIDAWRPGRRRKAYWCSAEILPGKPSSFFVAGSGACLTIRRVGRSGKTGLSGRGDKDCQEVARLLEQSLNWS